MKLTCSQTRYLITIYKLSDDEEGIRSIGIAEERCQELNRLGSQLETMLKIPSDLAEEYALLLISELPQTT